MDLRATLRAVPATVIVGAQWGDEGKGKIVDLLAPCFDVVARYQGGPNAGQITAYACAASNRRPSMQYSFSQ